MNTTYKAPSAPADLKRSGRELWSELLRHLVLDAHELRLLHEAGRAADRCDELARELARQGFVLPNGRPNPLLRETREQEITLARLITALRLPADLSEGPRPQRRGLRGVYRVLPGGVAE